MADIVWTDAGLGVQATVDGGIIAVLGTRVKGGMPRITFAPAPSPFLSTFEQGRAFTVVYGQAVIEAALASPPAGEPVAQAAAAGFAKRMDCRLGGRTGSGTVGQIWQRSSGNGFFQLCFDDVFASLMFETNSGNACTPLFTSYLEETGETGKTTAMAWPAALGTMKALVGMAIEMARLFEADGGTKSKRRRA